MEEVLKKAEAEAEHLEKETVQLGEKAEKNKMKIVGVIASGLSICMYVSYIPQILGNLSGHQGVWIQPSSHSSTARCGLDTDFSKSIATGRL